MRSSLLGRRQTRSTSRSRDCLSRQDLVRTRLCQHFGGLGGFGSYCLVWSAWQCHQHRRRTRTDLWPIDATLCCRGQECNILPESAVTATPGQERLEREDCNRSPRPGVR